MADALAEVEAELNDAAARARKLVDSTAARFFTVRPAPTSWSAAECIAHLSISTEMFLPVLRKAIDDGRENNLTTDKQPSMDILGRILRWFLEPPIRQRVKTSAPFVPKAIRAKSEALAEFMNLQNRLLSLLHEARGLHLKKMRIVSPFDKRVKYNVFSAFHILVAHQRRHLWQAEQVIEQLKASSKRATGTASA